MNRTPRPPADPLEQKIELALQPEAFISDWGDREFMADLRAVAADLAELISSEPERAVILYETFLAACHLKAEEVDDSSGSFGQFVAALFCGWIRARQAAGTDPEETVGRLLGWMDKDPYGFCHRLEEEAVKVLDRAGLDAFAKQVRAQLDRAMGVEYLPCLPGLCRSVRLPMLATRRSACGDPGSHVSRSVGVGEVGRRNGGGSSSNCQAGYG
jgi:hypothetical protein